MVDGNAAQRRKEQRAEERLNAPVDEAISEHDQDQDERNNVQEKQEKRPNKLFEWLRRYFPGPAVCTAIFTGILTLFTYFQYRISHITSEIQRNSERAFLTFSGPAVGARIINGTAGDFSVPWTLQEVALNWQNNGETPARNIVIHLGAGAYFPDIPAEFDFAQTSGVINAVIGPKSNYGTNIQVPKDDIVDASHGKKRLFVWGTATYDDVFANSPKRLSEFCVELTHLTFAPVTSQQPADSKQISTAAQGFSADDPHMALIGFQWQQCRAHNCYDGDCKDYTEVIKPNS